MTETNDAPRPAKSRRQRRRQRHRPPAAGPATARWALAVALLALAAGGYLLYQGEIKPRIDAAYGVGVGGSDSEQRLDAMEEDLAARDSAQAELRARVARLEAQLGEAETNAAALESRLLELRGALDEQQTAAQTRAQQAQQQARELADSLAELRAELAGYQSADARQIWRLAEAEHLLVIANQRLQLARDAALARRALALADARLRDIPDPALAPARALIADEIIALDRAAAVDVAGTLHQLAALARAVEALPLAGDALARVAPAAIDSPAAEAAPEAKTETTSWLSTGKNLLADLGDLVQVETVAPGPPVVLTAETRALKRAGARLILEAAQLAFLRGDGAVYAERTAAAADWVRAHFAAESAAGRAWLARLEALAAVSPAAELPDISRSLRALREAAGR